MSQLLSPSKPSERISQLLPSVKCSTCGKPVALNELGDHVCAPIPPVPRPSPSQGILAKIRQDSIQGPPALPPIVIPAAAPQRVASPGPRVTTPLSARARTPQPAPPVVVPLPQQAIQGIVLRGQSPAPLRVQTPQMPPQPSRNSAVGQLPPVGRAQTPQVQPPIAPRVPTTGRFDTFPRPNSTAPNGRLQIPNSSAGPPRMQIPPIPIPAEGRDGNSSLFASRPSMDRPSSTRPSLDGGRAPHPLAPQSASPKSASPLANGGSGGEVNMAGVGRRGFQAAAQAAMMAASFAKSSGLRSPPLGMDGRRMNAPSQLNIDANVSMQGSSLSPNTPHSSHSSHSPRSPASHAPYGLPQPSIVSSRTPSPPSLSFSGLQAPISPKSPDIVRTMTPDTVRAVSPVKPIAGSPLSDNKMKINTSLAYEKLDTDSRNREPPSPGADSDYSGSGLAYDQDSESVFSPPSQPASLPDTKSNSGGSIKQKSPSDKFAFPLKSPPSPVVPPARSISSGSAYSYASRSTSKSTSALERTPLDSIFENPRSPTATNGIVMSPPTKSPKLPTRSRTAPALSASKADPADSLAKRNRPRQCTRCSKMIDDGRWVRAEGAGVLCERCWKTMYLPKCRRCNRPIEKQAVSSADGQLKGKYHRECFNCHKCHQLFPDKEFYVFDGKPFCRYHYHEANDSLCADPSCGQPIEGPCAVAHTGERYHPDHLICEYEYPYTGKGGKKLRCRERLEEYWEVDGHMLCEKHAMHIDGDGDEEPIDDVQDESQGNSDADARARRRKTQFIDLR